jgi:hypothetical protein
MSISPFACPEYYSKQLGNEQYTSLLLKKKKRKKNSK